MLGLILFGIACIWPPLILLITLVVASVVPYSFRITDDASVRRRLWQEYKTKPTTLAEIRETPSDIVLEESYWINSRGRALMTGIMKPANGKKIKAVICFCHGYSDNASFVKRREYMRMVRKGCVVLSIEYEGHGRSDGPLALVYDWKLLIEDVHTFYSETITKHFSRKTPCFLVGESLGGAVAVCTYQRSPSLFAGVLFLGPMIKISDEVMPHPIVEKILKALAGNPGSPPTWFNRLAITPAKHSMDEVGFHDKTKRDIILSAPTIWGRKARLITARELLGMSIHVSSLASEFHAPFFILHGSADKITDPNLSQSFHDESPSKDKTIKIYDGLWHNLTGAESDEDTEMLFDDMWEWISKRS